MPIGICYIKNKVVDHQKFETHVSKWADKIGVNTSDVSITIIRDFAQFGQTYDILFNLYLPSIWSKKDTSMIQTELLAMLCEAFKIHPKNIFILTNIIQSGHVVENGKIVNWK